MRHHPTTLINWLNNRTASLPEAERRRVRVLTWLQGMLVLMVAVALVTVLIVDNSPTSQRSLYVPLIGGLFIILCIGLGLNFYGRYTAALILSVACGVVGPWLSILLDPSVGHGDFVPMVYVALSMQLAAILLSEPLTIILAGLQFMALVLFRLYHPDTAAFNWPSLLVFIFFLSLLSVVTNFISRRDLRQIDQQTRRLIDSEDRLRELSVRDSLTTLFNRRYLEETLARELRRAERKRISLGILMVDVDHFKRYNDTYGHGGGDALLQELGLLFRKQVRGYDIACRYGGEEFILMLPEISPEIARMRAEEICAAVRHLRPHYDGHSLEAVSISVGVSLYPEHGLTGEALIAAADAALYQAKHEGRDRVVMAGRPAS
jgi:diguanylate cyclase (GGDEF)-like protein